MDGPSEIPRKKRHFDYKKCAQCREAKQKCLPINRRWPMKCDRCSFNGLPCSEGTIIKKLRRNPRERQISSASIPSSALEFQSTRALGSSAIPSITQGAERLPFPEDLQSLCLITPSPGYPCYATTSTPNHSCIDDDLSSSREDAVITGDIFDPLQRIRYSPVSPVEKNCTFYDFLAPLDDGSMLILKDPVISPRTNRGPIARYLDNLPKLGVTLAKSLQLSHPCAFVRPCVAQLPSELELRLSNKDIANRILHTAIYQLVNSLVLPDWSRTAELKANPKFEPIKVVLSSLCQAPLSMTKKLCNSIPRLYSQVLKRNLLRWAIVAGIPRVILGLQQSVIPGQSIPVESLRAVFTISNIPTVKALLEGFISKNFEPSDEPERQAMFYNTMQMRNGRAKDLWHETVLVAVQTGFDSREQGGVAQDAQELLDTILNLGGSWNELPFNYLLPKLGPSVLNRLLGQNTTFETLIDGIQRRCLVPRVAENLSEGDSIEFFTKVLRRLPKDRLHSRDSEKNAGCHCVPFQSVQPGDSLHSHFTGLLWWSISNKQLRLAHALLEEHIIPDACCLIHAVDIGDTALVQRLLHASRKPSELILAPCTAESSQFQDTRMTTAYGEAVRLRYYDIQQLFNALISEYTHEEESLLACLVAAAEAGDQVILARCLHHMPVAIRAPVHRLDHSFRNQHIDITNAIQDSLSVAIQHKNGQIVNTLLEVGAEVDDSVLLLAFRARDPFIVHEILQYRAENRLPTESIVRSILIEAVCWNDLSILKLLLQLGDFRQYIPDALCEAIRTKKRDTIEVLKDYGVTLSGSSGSSFLRDIISNGEIDLLAEWLGRGANPCEDGVLASAVSEGNHEMCYMLLAAIKERYPKGNGTFGIESLTLAIAQKDPRLLRLLASHLGGRRVTKWAGFGKVLGSAVLVRGPASFEMMAILLEYGADPNESFNWDSYDQFKGTSTAFLLAIKLLDIGKVRLLLEKANINLPAELGLRRTPLQLAAELGDHEMVSFLLRHGADPNQAASYVGGGTALQLAAMGGFIEIVELLMSRGADLNAPPAKRYGRTPFEASAEHGRLDMMKFLVEEGAFYHFDGEQQVQRAMKFAENNDQREASQFAKDLWNKFCQDQDRAEEIPGGYTLDTGCGM